MGPSRSHLTTPFFTPTPKITLSNLMKNPSTARQKAYVTGQNVQTIIWQSRLPGGLPRPPDKLSRHTQFRELDKMSIFQTARQIIQTTRQTTWYPQSQIDTHLDSQTNCFDSEIQGVKNQTKCLNACRATLTVKQSFQTAAEPGQSTQTLKRNEQLAEQSVQITKQTVQTSRINMQTPKKMDQTIKQTFYFLRQEARQSGLFDRILKCANRHLDRQKNCLHDEIDRQKFRPFDRMVKYRSKQAI